MLVLWADLFLTTCFTEQHCFTWCADGTHLLGSRSFVCMCVSALLPTHATRLNSPSVCHWICASLRFLQQSPTLPPGRTASGKSCFLGCFFGARRISCRGARSRWDHRLLCCPLLCMETSNNNYHCRARYETTFWKMTSQMCERRHDDTAKSPRVRWSLIGDSLLSSSSWVGSRPYITASSPSILTLKYVQSLLKVLHPWNSGHQPPVLPEAGGKRTEGTIFCCLPHASVALCSPLPRARPNYSLQADV